MPLWRDTNLPALSEICVSDPSVPFQHAPMPLYLTFTAFGSLSYFLVQGYRSLLVLENMKSVFLNLLVPFQVVSEKKVELFETRNPCSKTMINNIAIALASVSQ